MARRLSAVMAPSLQKLWERCHLTEMERMLKHDNLPMRVNPKWFRQTFLDADAPPALGPKDEVWPYVRVRLGLTSTRTRTRTQTRTRTLILTRSGRTCAASTSTTGSPRSSPRLKP